MANKKAPRIHGMDDYYKNLYKKAADMQYKLHDYTVQSASNPSTMVIRHEMHSLANDLATSKSPYTIEARLKTIDRQLRQAEMHNPAAMPGRSPIMHYENSNFLRKNLEGMRMNIRQHPHY